MLGAMGFVPLVGRRRCLFAARPSAGLFVLLFATGPASETRRPLHRIVGAGGSSRLQGLSATAEVSGRQQRHPFQIQMPGEAAEHFLEELREACSGADSHFWMIPVPTRGSLRHG